MKRFEEVLYSAVCEIFPKTTVRSFSQSLGMSDGYWSSIMAQGLTISNVGLMNLHEYLETRRILVANGDIKEEKIILVQRMIVDEVIYRFMNETHSLVDVQAKNQMEEMNESGNSDKYYGAMPFIRF